MKGTGKAYIFLAIISILISCDNDESVDLPPADERVSEAKSNFRNELTAPENGWELEYQPTNGSGAFLMLLKFDADGNVNIKSDIAVNDGEFYDQTITYRIDNAHGLELILETYAVFHYMFELESSTFGAEFEFLFKEKNGDNLVFESISDGANPTQLIFEPAGSNAENAFSRDISKNLDNFNQLIPDNYRDGPVSQYIPVDQQVILEDQNISIFWSLNLSKRTIEVHGAGIGTDANDIFTNDNFIGIFHNTGYTLENGEIVLRSPLSFTLDGKQINIEEIALNDFDMSAEPFCPASNSENGPKYQGQVSGIGAVTLINTLFSGSGSGFQPQSIYSINPFYISDKEGNALLDDGIIQEHYPSALAFYFLYDVELTNDSIPSSSIGFASEDGNLHLREFETTTTDLNRVKITFTDNYYFTGGATQDKIDDINTVTNEIFDGGEIYAYGYLASQSLTLFRLYNPCNGYEFLLVQ